ncbi:nucleotidyltransferase domain-containing protein [Micromonospora yasonensis]|uniref:nucleotidyltransferase domain-containing protein n=1 Tax=Micromonospora yasonensis TaxID=1128667 RepID=UPI00222F31C4|nr:nucleotidyltransferase domain-containing protein [Micromonospora yasonensis]MCW3842205.1 nucleotidyltransferase domain-containing protein [Micromonospora yasonensis]
MVTAPAVVEEFGREVAALGWVSDLLVAGSLATGDYLPGISDLDLVALADGPVDAARQATLAALHRRLDGGTGTGLNLGCVYVDAATIPDVQVRHPTWTHGQLVQRILSGITRAELVRHGYAVFGRPPGDVLPAMDDGDIRAAARAELTGYWAWAARRPWLWRDPALADLGLTSMARGRHALRTGQLLTKTAAIRQADAPAWLIDQVSARRRGERVASPRLRAALVAWRDARRTVAQARRPAPRVRTAER